MPGLGTDIVNGGDQALDSITGPTNLYQYGLDASWELDLFGRVRRSVEQARAQAEAQSKRSMMHWSCWRARSSSPTCSCAERSP